MTPKTLDQNTKIAVVGLGYVGLPLACEFSRRYPTTGFDINKRRVTQVSEGLDINKALTAEELKSFDNLRLTHDSRDMAGTDIFVITAPTPVDSQNQPDLGPIRHASTLVAEQLSKGNLVIFESTVYPGATEEVCIPILEQISGLKLNQDFYVGYSPERVNPGDQGHQLTNIVKVTSGSCEIAAELVDNLYLSIITAGTHRASSIKVAEAAKVIENTQRDLNIALINELAILFNRMNIDTHEVLQAAGSKWNFLKFHPGLVGGHCIGVDPYYLTYKAQQLGYHPEVILAGRRINDSMGEYVAEQTVKLMLGKRIHVVDSRILVLGLTFKENCPDTRNSRVVDIIRCLQSYHAAVDVHDPWVAELEPSLAGSVNLTGTPQPGSYDAIVIAVAHREFVSMGIELIRKLGKSNCIVYDVKSTFPSNHTDGRL
ncbi:MAG: nucleotide sugar dehydrogenase [Pseudohongiellaceae bacterium]